MSKPVCTLALFLVTAFLTLLSAQSAPAQRVEAAIVIGPGSTAAVRGKFLTTDGLKNRKTFSFMRSVAGIDGLGSRVSNVKLFGPDGKPIGFRKLIDGEFLADVDIASWSYEFDLTPVKNRNAAAHVSWIVGQNGVLLAVDMLPEAAASGILTINAPPDWEIWDRMSEGISDRTIDGRRFEFEDKDDLALAVGKSWTRLLLDQPDTDIVIALSGTWHFTPDEVMAMTEEISSAYRRDLGPIPGGRAQIVFSNFPTATGHGIWQAETRGTTITIISSDMAFRTQSLQRLHEQLRHELFHLWIPNGVNLTGNYDWFYEGFALYQSLKLAVGLNRIRFADFLDTLSRAHTIDSAGSQRMSLIQASATRFSGSNTQVYARGMLVGFLCDLAMLEKSKGKRSVETILKEIFNKHRKPAQAMDGNTAAIAVLRSNSELVPIVEKYVTGSEKIDWTVELSAAGIEDGDQGPLTVLRVKQKLGRREKTILDKLGYNNWRRSSRNSK